MDASPERVYTVRQVTESMRVLFVNSVYGTGSTGKIIADIVNRLAKEGHEAKVLYGVGAAPAADSENAVKTAGKLDYSVHNALSRVTDHAGLYSSNATRRLIREIKAYHPELIHLHTLHGYYVNYELLFAYLREAKIPVVWTLHDCWSFTGHCTHFVSTGCEKWKTQCADCQQLHAYPKCYTRGDVARNYQRKKRAFTALPEMTIVTPSEWLGECVRQSFLKRYPVQVIHNGIDLTVFHPRKSAFRERFALQDKFVILGVANQWDRRKGFDVFLEMARRLSGQFQIVLVGTSEQNDRILPEQIISVHRTHNQQELAELYSAADLFVNPTREETFGLVNVEALACGTPVVTFQTGGCPEIVDESCGMVVPCEDTEALEKAIYQVYEMPERFPERACLQRAETFSSELQCERYLSLYRAICEKTTDTTVPRRGRKKL